MVNNNPKTFEQWCDEQGFKSQGTPLARAMRLTWRAALENGVPSPREELSDIGTAIPAVEGKPLELQSRDELLAYAKQIQAASGIVDVGNPNYYQQAKELALEVVKLKKRLEGVDLQ